VDAEGRIAVESHRIAGLAHGTPIAPAHDGPGGRRISRMGVASDFVLDIGISSTWRIAQSWGLAPQREDAPLVAAKPRAAPRPKVAVAPKAAVPAKRKAARKPRRVAGFGFDPGFGLRLAMAPMASLRRMLGGRKR
jgi:feruloyl esterase